MREVVAVARARRHGSASIYGRDLGVVPPLLAALLLALKSNKLLLVGAQVEVQLQFFVAVHFFERHEPESELGESYLHH